MKRRAGTSLDSAIVDVLQREVGQLSTRRFSHRLGASEDLVLKLDIFKKLEKHRGCVNTISFNADGDILVSGSDDKKIILWDWERGNAKFGFSSGHNNNVFQAKIMPFSQDCVIVTCAADGQVRHALILEGGMVRTRTLAKHQGRAHKLAIEPGSPNIFYTCGEDGLVQHIDLRADAATKLFTCKSVQNRLYGPIIHLNTIAIDPRNPNLFAVAGSDEYARLYDIRKYKWDGSSNFGQPADCFCPLHLIGDDHVGITGLAFSDKSELLVSYNNEYIYLFQKDMGLGLDPDPTPARESTPVPSDADAPLDGDVDPKFVPQVYKGHRNCETVKGVNFFGPKCEYVVSGSDCGRIFMWRRDGKLIRAMEADNHVVNCIEGHPFTPTLASSGIDNDIKIWTPKATERAVLPTNIETGKFVQPRFYILPFGGEYDSEDDEDDDDDDIDADSDDDDDDDDNSSDDDKDDDDDDENDEDNDDETDSGSDGPNNNDIDDDLFM